MTEILCIDVSENNGYVDWDAVVAAGVKGVIVRVGYGVSGNEDSRFRQNANEALAHGLKVGGYWYSYALDTAGAVLEAQHCKRIISEWGGVMELPVFFDMEDADGYKSRHSFQFDSYQITAMCQSFIQELGLNCGVYASYSWLCNYIDWRSLGCSVWNAEWGDDDSIMGYAWQFTDSYYIDGNYFDANIFRVY